MKLSLRVLATAASLIFLVGTAAAAQKLPDIRELAKQAGLVDGIDRLHRNYFYRQGHLRFNGWADNRHIVARLWDPNWEGATTKFAYGKSFIVDVDSGDMKEAPWGPEFDVLSYCASTGQVVLSTEVHPKKPTSYRFGPLRGPYIEYTSNVGRTGLDEWNEQRLIINRTTCGLVHNAIPGHAVQLGMLRQISFLEPEHGWMYEENAVKDDGRVRVLAMVKPDGEVAVIPTTSGERSFTVSRYLPFADAYLVGPKVNGNHPLHPWTDHFMRLVHPDGQVERIPFPTNLLEGLRPAVWSVHPIYTRRGMLWYLNMYDRLSGAPRLIGAYMEIDGALVRIAQHLFFEASPDGCRVVGRRERTGAQMRAVRAEPMDYFVINLCEQSSSVRPN